MGNTTAVLVALPSVMDPIRLVGDEDKHATLLFFGETATLPDDAKTVLLNAVGQAAKLITPFSESITDVARLGSENPPALVAMLTNNTLGMIRDVLQINPRLVEFLSNGMQHPGYTPHVTLAYPDYNNEAKLRDLVKKLYRVKFDRLALWWGDEQIEFSLGSSTYDDTEMSMSDNLEEFLAHYGISHAAVDAGGSPSSGGKFSESKVKRDGRGRFAQTAGSNFKTLAELNAYQEKLIKDAFGSDIMGKASTVKEFANLFEKGPERDKALAKMDEISAYVLTQINQSPQLQRELMKKERIAHSDLADFLAHHGIKGQRWGVRRSSSEIQRATITKPDGEQTLAVVNNKTKTAMEVHGDKKGTIATEYRLTKYGTDVVSNKELDSYMKRVDLEKKYATYATSKQASNRGVKKFIGEVISNAAKNEVSQLSQGKQGPIMKQVRTAMAAKSGGKHAKK